MRFAHGDSMTGRSLRYWLVRSLLVIVLFAAAPLILVLIATVIANANGCTLNEAQLHPCVVFGVDWGGMLYGMAVMGWLGIVTLQFGAMALFVWLVVAAILLFRHWRRRSDPA
jgi:hypothetical protein